MSEESVLATIPQEVNKFKDAVFAVYGAVAPLVLCYDIDETDPFNPKITFRFLYLNKVQRSYTHYMPYLQVGNIKYILKQGVLDLIEYLESHINDEISDDFIKTNIYGDAIGVLEKKLGIYPSVFMYYDTISGGLRWGATASSPRATIAHCKNQTNLDGLPYEMQVQVFYESIVQAMAEPLQKIYDTLCA